MALPTSRYYDMAPIAQAQLIRGFLRWAFRLPGNQAVTTGGQGLGQRAIAAGVWRPIVLPANGVMATGGEGIVHLWCRVDPNNLTIQDRVVVKNVVSGSTRYLDPHNWASDTVGGEPLECRQANVVWSVTTPADRKHIQACLGWGDVVPPHYVAQNYRYKIYNEYCAHKNLHKIMKNQPKRKKKGAVRRGRRQFPEPFLWYMFESLAKACIGMNRAYMYTGVVHQDLHPGNGKQSIEAADI
ncbi:hypothetical protein M436DRAFT_37105 [Aureobasidium namibiae CBS 147.97]|uniref:Fungal-type protein kinase domain-containing protein n=1 Tax=Aureobasidium namibiae CBS 147.97 TaxID=1043004 RepID=A0A074WWY3_9PEZI|nr:uncharacterized protein M436DRAFT_37105 [Aureobasidium namibiae CBS 147.97]KEQ77673.1 hypothetical protein M436DRAFT_37105 [Aureobasidium namibiae CBS 147.97]